MPEPLIGFLPRYVELSPGYVIRVTALDPATGAQVTGVTVANVTLQLRQVPTDQVGAFPSLLVVQPDVSSQPPPTVVGSAGVTVSYTVQGTNIVLTWPAVAGAVGYEFLRDGVRVSNSWNGSLTTVTFAIPQDGVTHTFAVVALQVADTGTVTYPPPVTPPTPPPPTTTARVGVTNNLTGGGNRQHVLDLGVKLIREDNPSADVLTWARSNGIQVVGIMYGATTGLNADIIEGDNEPYNSSTWDLNTWASRMLACAKAAKSAGKTFLLPVGPPWNNGNVNIGGTWRDCVAAINAAQPTIWQYVDGISVHPYSQPDDPSIRVPILDKWRQNLTTVGHGGIPFWCTEFGWPTGGNTWPGGTYTEQAQADYFTKYWATIGARPDVKVNIPYRLDDFGPRDSDSEHWFGLNRPDGTHKPAWSVVKGHV